MLRFRKFTFTFAMKMLPDQSFALIVRRTRVLLGPSLGQELAPGSVLLLFHLRGDLFYVEVLTQGSV